VAVVKEVILPNRITNPLPRVVEPELDMARFRHRQVSKISAFRALIQKLVPAAQWQLRSPMRSIARELEEVWPSSER
jgi:hypothetical protein